MTGNPGRWQGLVLGAGLLVVPDIALAACTCGSMLVRAGEDGSSQSSVYCTSNQADIEANCTNLGKGQQGCQASRYAYRCPLGAVSVSEDGDQRIGWNFEIAVTLTGGSNPADCDHAQIATRTAKVNGHVAPNQSAEEEPEEGTYEFQSGPEVEVVDRPTPYPQFGATKDGNPLFGADGYEESTSQQNLNIRNQAPQITWIDTPDFSWESDETGDVSFEFISWADASDDHSQDNCWCRFKIQRTWDGTQAGGTGFQYVGGVNCGVGD